MLHLILLSFNWLPPILAIPVRAVISIAILILAMRILKLIWDTVSIFFQFFGGLLSRVVAFFV